MFGCFVISRMNLEWNLNWSLRKVLTDVFFARIRLSRQERKKNTKIKMDMNMKGNAHKGWSVKILHKGLKIVW